MYIIKITIPDLKTLKNVRKFHEKWSRVVTQKLQSRTEIRDIRFSINNKWNIYLSHTGKDRRLLKEIFLGEFAGRYQVRPPCYFTINWAHNTIRAVNSSRKVNHHVWGHILSHPSASRGHWCWRWSEICMKGWKEERNDGGKPSAWGQKVPKGWQKLHSSVFVVTWSWFSWPCNNQLRHQRIGNVSLETQISFSWGPWVTEISPRPKVRLQLWAVIDKGHGKRRKQF